MIEQQDLLLIPFPFSDQSGRKVRPVMVVSNNEFNKYSEDILVVGVTSNIVRNKYSLILTNDDLIGGNLITKCCIKVENILKIDKELIIKKIGKTNKDKLKKVLNILISMIE